MSMSRRFFNYSVIMAIKNRCSEWIDCFDKWSYTENLVFILSVLHCKLTTIYLRAFRQNGRPEYTNTLERDLMKNIV